MPCRCSCVQQVRVVGWRSPPRPCPPACAAAHLGAPRATPAESLLKLIHHRMRQCALKNGACRGHRAILASECRDPHGAATEPLHTSLSATHVSVCAESAGWSPAVGEDAPTLACVLEAFSIPGAEATLPRSAVWILALGPYLATLRGQHYAQREPDTAPDAGDVSRDVTALQACCRRLAALAPLPLLASVASPHTDAALAGSVPGACAPERSLAGDVSQGAELHAYPVHSNKLGAALTRWLTHAFGAAVGSVPRAAVVPTVFADAGGASVGLRAAGCGWLQRGATAHAEWVWHAGTAARASAREGLRLPDDDGSAGDERRVEVSGTSRHLFAALDAAVDLMQVEPSVGGGEAGPGSDDGEATTAAAGDSRAATAAQGPTQASSGAGTVSHTTAGSWYLATSAAWFLGWVSGVTNAGLRGDLTDASQALDEVPQSMWTRAVGRQLLVHSDAVGVLERLRLVLGNLRAFRANDAPFGDDWAPVGFADPDTSGEDGGAGVPLVGELVVHVDADSVAAAGSGASGGCVDAGVAAARKAGSELAPVRPPVGPDGRRHSWTNVAGTAGGGAAPAGGDAKTGDDSAFAVEVPRGQRPMRVTAPRRRVGAAARSAKARRRGALGSGPAGVWNAMARSALGRPPRNESACSSDMALDQLQRCAWKLQAAAARSASHVRSFTARVRLCLRGGGTDVALPRPHPRLTNAVPRRPLSRYYCNVTVSA